MLPPPPPPLTAGGGGGWGGKEAGVAAALSPPGGAGGGAGRRPGRSADTPVPAADRRAHLGELTWRAVGLDLLHTHRTLKQTGLKPSKQNSNKGTTCLPYSYSVRGVVLCRPVSSIKRCSHHRITLFYTRTHSMVTVYFDTVL